jgi:molybdopterin synthase sulfur carrier subunit
MDILLFGIAKDIVGESRLQLGGEEEELFSVGQLKRFLKRRFPEFSNLTSFAVAVNSEYAEDDVPLGRNDEIAIIPPVSGG